MTPTGDVHATVEVGPSVASPLPRYPLRSSEDKALYQFLSSPGPLSLLPAHLRSPHLRLDS